MADQRELLDAHAHLTAAIRSGEAWEQSYKLDHATFRRLVAEEAALQSAANEYLLGLSERVPRLINWNDPQLISLQAAVVGPESSPEWQEELRLLMALVLPHILELTVIGAQAGERIYNAPLGLTTLDEFVLNAADKHTASLVSQVTSTTRRYIQKSIKRSIELGESGPILMERIRKQVASPVRAEMIAQTESVTAYQTGLDHFALKSGAESSTWDALIGACPLCAPLDGVTKPIGEPFQMPDGQLLLRPPGHVKCRCGRYLNYPK